MRLAVRHEAGGGTWVACCFRHLAVCFLAGVVLPAQASHVRRACASTNGTSAELPLQCPDGHVIHVESALTSLGYEGNLSDCHPLPDCVTTHTTDHNDLLPFCNGQQSCTETVILYKRNHCPDGSLPSYSQVQYSCIPSNQITDVCSDAYVTSQPGGDAALYFSSPAFLGGFRPQDKECSCRFHGDGLILTVLDLHFRETGGSLRLESRGAVAWSVTGAPILINMLVNESSFDTLVFSDNGLADQRAWLRLTASSGELTALCGDATTTTITTPTTFTTSSSANPGDISTDNTATTDANVTSGTASTPQDLAVSKTTTTTTTGSTSDVSTATSTTDSAPPMATPTRATTDVADSAGPSSASTAGATATTDPAASTNSTNDTSSSPLDSSGAPIPTTTAEESSSSVPALARPPTAAALGKSSGADSDNGSASANDTADREDGSSDFCDCGALVAVSVLCVILGVTLLASIAHQIGQTRRRRRALKAKATKVAPMAPAHDVPPAGQV